MKKTILLITVLFLSSYSFSQVRFNNDNDFVLTSFIDPTFTDAGFQFGAGIRKEFLFGGFTGVEISTYPDLTPTYTDLVVNIGFILEFGSITSHWGEALIFGRALSVWRGSTWHAGVGWAFQFDFKICDWLKIGPRLWADYRTDQADEFFGDSDAHQYLIFSSPFVQENGSMVLTIKLD